MYPTKTNQYLALAAMLSVSLTASTMVQAGHGKWLSQTGCVCCPECNHCCELKAEQVKEEKSCFDVESKLICIPRVVFPWQRKSATASCASCDSCDGQGCKSCIHNGARVRRICVLTTEKYECPACEYTWSPRSKSDCDSCDLPGLPVAQAKNSDETTTQEVEEGAKILQVDFKKLFR